MSISYMISALFAIAYMLFSFIYEKESKGIFLPKVDSQLPSLVPHCHSQSCMGHPHINEGSKVQNNQ